MGESVQSTAYICPVCGKSFSDIHAYAAHLNEHSTEVKKREAEEEKKRFEDQKKVDAAKVEKLRKAYVAALEVYAAAQREYEEKYGIEGTEYTLFGSDLWNHFANRFNKDWSRYF